MLQFCVSSYALTGNQAVQFMTGTEQKETHLLAYANGVVDQEIVVRENAKAAALAGATKYIVPFCMPSTASISQAAQIIKRELLSKPENNHESLLLVSRIALTKAWPCTDAQILE